MKRWSLLTLLLLPMLAGLFTLTAKPAPAAQAPVLDHDVVVVKAYYDSKEQVDDIASVLPPWEVNQERQYIVVEVDASEYALLEQLGFRVEVDDALTLELNTPRVISPNQGGGIPGYSCYRTVEETFDSALALATNYPHLAEWMDVGDSWEKVTPGGLPGYDMMVLRLTNENMGGVKPKLFATGAIHAREYTTAELLTRFAEYLINNYGIDADATWLLDHHEIHLMLQTNPDGRKHAETGLSWRKNTNNNYCANSNDRGADLNRNFSFQWGCCGGSSGNVCSETYRGASAGSEPETQAVQNYLLNNFEDLRDPDLGAAAPLTTTGVYLDIHSYSQLVLWPWGFPSQSGNDTQLTTLGRKMAYFNNYMPQQSYDLYATDGTTIDFAYGELGLPAYTFELGTSFFQSCSSFESTIFPDNLESLIYTAKALREPYMAPAGPEALNASLVGGAVAAGTPVTITAVLDDSRYSTNNGTEPVHNISAAEYYIDVPYWITDTTPVALPMVAADGNFNSPVETATAVVDTTGLASGRHTIFIRGQDSNGSWGVVSALFLYIIEPGVSPIIGGEVTALDSGMPVAATITANNNFHVSNDPGTGIYQMNVISDTYTLTAVPANPDYAPTTVTGIVAHNGQTVQQNFQLNRVCMTFEDDVEGGNIGWTADSPWAITTESAHSPTHSWTDSPSGNYGNNRNVSLTSPIFDLTDKTGVTLAYWQICDTEAGYDYCRVEISTNGGSSWSEVTSFSGASSAWSEVMLPLPALDNQANARIRFRLTSDGFVNDDGWHIDDIRLFTVSPSCTGEVAPQAAFTSTSPDALGSVTSFTNNSVGSNLDFVWDFGDGNNSTAVNPTHTYAAVGSYTVTLTATNSLGSDVATAVVEILETPVAAFSSNSPVLLGDTAVFTNTSTGTDLTYSWDFGDGNSSTDANPTHSYAAVGSYTVTLTVSNGLGSDVATAVVDVYEAIHAAFSTNSPVTLGEAVIFTNTSIGTDLTYNWDFGDGNSSADANPSHTYAWPGTYTVTLVISNGVDTDTAVDTVVVLDDTPPPGYIIYLPIIIR